MSSESSYVGGRLFRRIGNHCEAADLGWAFPADAGVQCFPGDPGRVRRPDASFVRRERLADGPGAGFLRLAPDLVVEVLSPHDLAYEVDQKIVEYLLARVRLVWVVNPGTRQVRVHRLDGSVSVLGADGELSGEDVLPGFRCPVGELFAGLKLAGEERPAGA